MQRTAVQRAVTAATSIASGLGLEVDDTIILQNANRLAVRLLPCDILARVAHVARQANAAFEVEIARRLAETDSPVAALEPRAAARVYVRDGFVITMWSYHAPVSRGDIDPAAYAQVLQHLHAGMRAIDLTAPHFTDRVAAAQRLVDNPALSPRLGDGDRELLRNALGKLRWAISQHSAAEQLLHGEPHPGNLLQTKNGLLVVDLETCCRGPVEFDIAHAPEAVGAHYPDADPDLICKCRLLMLAMVAAWRWDRDDHFPNGREMGVAFLGQLRAGLERHGLAAT